MGNWILERACRDASLWPEDWKVSVNISSGQFFDRGFESQVTRALAVSGLSPARLKLEVTESVLIGDEANVVEVLQRIRTQQVTIAMDDFGTGYSSLSYLKNIPLDELKIDRSFVIAMEDDPNAEAIVETIIHLARMLKLTTTAEGVETESQAQILKSLGCDCFQGYLYGKPMPVEQLLSMRNFRAV
jgi:EAL domain-containing protein (putative c-di-GMP-specific phosphodiesterase class I)